MNDLLLAMKSGLLWHLLRVCAGALLLFLVSALVGAVLVITKDPPAAIPPAPSTLAAVPIELPAVAMPDGGAEIVERPLFWSSRRPEVEAESTGPVAPVSGGDVLDKVVLLGVFSTGESGGAIVRIDGERQRLMIGQELQQWKLQGITAQEAEFVSLDDAALKRVLPLEYAEGK